jgi:branched-chain amino acid aminotransferase
MPIKPSRTIWHNGRLVPWEEATVHVLTHGLHYGSSVFEGIRAYETSRGPALFRPADHLRRLFASARIYRLELPFTREVLASACRDVVRVNDLKSAYLRPIAYRGYGSLGVGGEDVPVCVSIAAMEWGAYLGAEALEKGVDVCVSSWPRWAPHMLPAAAKAGGHYLSSQLVTQEAKRHGYAEGIALNAEGYVAEGAGENLFLAADGVIYTPPLSSSILPGITRDTVITLAREQGYDVREQPLTRESLYLADEIFLTGTAAEITPVRSVDGLTVGRGQRGPIAAELQRAFFDLVQGREDDPHGWLEWIDPARGLPLTGTHS